MRYLQSFQALEAYFPDVSRARPSTSDVLVRRDVTAEWIRSGYTKVDPAGFNPFTGSVFYSQHSIIDNLDRGMRDEGSLDLLMYEIFYALHDHVHVWALHALARLSLGESVEWATIADIDDTLFLGLLLFSEAAATAAIDYWLLCQRPVRAEIAGLKSFTSLTTPYRAVSDHSEFRAGSVRFAVETDDFLPILAEAYCQAWRGPLAELHAGSGTRMPDWLAWEHEQAHRQRRLAKSWLKALTGGNNASVHSEAAWFEENLPHIRSLSAELSAKVRSGRLPEVEVFRPIVGWCSEVPNHRDFRFLNLSSLISGRCDIGGLEVDDPYASSQLIARWRPKAIWEAGCQFAGRTLDQVPFHELAELLRDVQPLDGGDTGPCNLFFVS
jgi:hypothetical protein